MFLTWRFFFQRMNTDTTTIVATTVFFENKVNVFYIGPKIIYFFDGRSPTKPNVLVLCGLFFLIRLYVNQAACLTYLLLYIGANSAPFWRIPPLDWRAIRILLALLYEKNDGKSANSTTNHKKWRICRNKKRTKKILTGKKS